MLERQLELEGGLLFCDLGGLHPDGGQILECSLCLEQVAPERRVSVEVEVLEHGNVRESRLLTVPAHHASTPLDQSISGIRFFFPDGDGPRTVTSRASAHYLDRNARSLLP